MQPEAPPAPAASALSRLLGLLAFLHVYAGGVAAVGVIAALGAPLAMLGQMMSGWTEPDEPHLPFPWVPSLLCSLLPFPLAWARRWLWASLATIPMTAVPLVHLVRLFYEAGPA